jgi:hypothetical protein
MTPAEIYDTLSAQYASPYPDKLDDRNNAIKFLGAYFKEHPDKLPHLKPKLEQLMHKQKNMKVKFASIITDKYWEKEYVKPISVRRYNANQR